MADEMLEIPKADLERFIYFIKAFWDLARDDWGSSAWVVTESDARHFLAKYDERLEA